MSRPSPISLSSLWQVVCGKQLLDIGNDIAALSTDRTIAGPSSHRPQEAPTIFAVVLNDLFQGSSPGLSFWVKRCQESKQSEIAGNYGCEKPLLWKIGSWSIPDSHLSRHLSSGTPFASGSTWDKQMPAFLEAGSARGWSAITGRLVRFWFPFFLRASLDVCSKWQPRSACQRVERPKNTRKSED